MSELAGYFTPMLHVGEVERSIAFYRLLGFELIDEEGVPGCPLGWARMHCEGGAVMFLRAEFPFDVTREALLFYLYAPDLPALREHLVANGVTVTPITHPEYMPSGEMNLFDPDGYRIAVGHWSDVEHQEWLRRIEEKKQLREKSS
jgi:catechol 2,3-dioxygenase-like lactoylglutathione lyase family enzyme